MAEKKTHREVKNPRVSMRYLADYMAASEQAKRTIIRDCKFPRIARVVQHDEAKAIVASFLLSENPSIDDLRTRADQIRTRLADDDFERDLLDHNADYVDRFADACGIMSLPECDILPPGKATQITINGLILPAEIHVRLQRLTKTNKVRCGAVMLRYLKGKPLSSEIGAWQSAILYGYLGHSGLPDEGEPEHKLCITLDALTGTCHAAPTDAIRRFKNVQAACSTIVERWPNISPPLGAVF